MFEIIGIVYFVFALAEVIMNTGDAEKHICMGIFFVVMSMAIKTHSETVQIKNYIKNKKDSQSSDVCDVVETIDEDY